MLLLTNMLCIAQNDTPMEVLVNIASQNERFVSHNLFDPDDRSATYLDQYLSNYGLLRLNKSSVSNLLSSKSEFVKLSIPNPNSGDFDLALVSFDIRSEGFSIVERNNGEDYEIEIPKALFYRGVLERGSDTQAGVSVFENEVYGLFSSLEGGNIILAKDPINPGKNEANYIVYYENDLKFDREMNCLSDKFEALDGLDLGDGSRSNVYDTCEDIEVEIQATNALYQKKGNNTFITSNYISAFFNNVAIIYRNENIYTSIKKIIVNTSSDDYASLTSAQSKLFKYAENTKNTYQNSGSELAHLVDYNEPGLGGIAWINVLCTNYFDLGGGQHYGAYAYSSIEDTYQEFPDYSLTVFMFSHEMGHNLGSRHTQSCSWPGGPIDNCAPVENGTCAPGPAPTNGGTIMSYCHLSGQPGINYSNGFGELPGNKIRTLTKQKTCTEKYTPIPILASVPNQTISANRECTDDGGWTHYYNDNNTSSEADDKLLLSVRKLGEDIGNLDDGSLIVQTKTSSNAGSGSTHISSPGYDASDDWHVMNRWFELIPTQEPNNPVTVRFPYTDDDFNDVMENQPLIADHTDLTFYKISLPGNPNPDNGHTNVQNEDITFYSNGGTASLSEWKYIYNGSGKHIAEFQVSSFSGGGGGFSENAGLIVPVELLSYTAEKRENKGLLSWQTSIEVDNDYFAIERSADGITFQEIGRVNGKGSSASIVDYDFIDRQPLNGINYYRLAQYDFNGDLSYLGIRSLDFSSHSSISIYPNPLHDETLFVEFESQEAGTVQFIVNSLDGRRVVNSFQTAERGSNLAELNLSDLVPGVYFIMIQSKNNSSLQKLIVD